MPMNICNITGNRHLSVTAKHTATLNLRFTISAKADVLYK